MSVKRKTQSATQDEHSVEFWKQRALEAEAKQNHSEDDIDIRPDKNIKIISLCNNKLILTTNKGKDAKQRTFEHFGQSKTVPYSMLVEMIENHPTFAERGVFYILDKDVVRKSGLEEAYSKLLKKEDIEKILNDSDNAFLLYKNSPEKQRELINEMIVEKLVKGQFNDLNLVTKISEEGKVDLLQKKKYVEDFQKLHPELATV